MERKIQFNFEYSNNRWLFIAKEQMDRKLLRGDIKGRRETCSTDLLRFLLKTVQSHQISRVGGFSLNGPSRILAKTGPGRPGKDWARAGEGVAKSRSSQKRA